MGCCKKAGPAITGIAAAGLATAVLGPAGIPIAGAIMSSLQNDPTPAGQAQYQAALEYNKEVDNQNAERQAIIAQYMAEALRGTITQEDVELGDLGRKAYNDMIAKYGDSIKSMTLQQVATTYPQDAANIMNSIASIIPELKGMSPDQIWAVIPSAFKEMQMSDLVAVLPNSSWLTGQANAGLNNTSNMVPILLAGGFATLGVVFMFARKKKNNV